MPLSEFDYLGIIVPLVSLALAVLKLYLDQRRTKREIEISKQGIMILSRVVESYKKGQESMQQLEREKLAFERWKAAAKAIGWIFERLESEEEE